MQYLCNISTPRLLAHYGKSCGKILVFAFFHHVLYVFDFSAILLDISTPCLSTYSLYQASFIETDSFVKILMKPAVCNCSSFLRHCLSVWMSLWPWFIQYFSSKCFIHLWNAKQCHQFGQHIILCDSFYMLLPLWHINISQGSNL